MQRVQRVSESVQSVSVRETGEMLEWSDQRLVVRSLSLPALDLALVLCLGLLRPLEWNPPGVVWAEGKVLGG